MGETWTEGEHRIAMKPFGLIPVGWQAIVVDLSASDTSKASLRDRGYGPMLREWDHSIFVEPVPGGRTTDTEKLRLDAGVLTPLIAFFARQFLSPPSASIGGA